MTMHPWDDALRGLMCEELHDDRTAGRLYLDPRLTPRGRGDWPELLHEALHKGSAVTLADRLRRRHRMVHLAPAHALSLVDGALALAEGEVGRFHHRAVCRQAISLGLDHVEVYRAHAPYRVRQSDARLVGRRLEARRLLIELRMPPNTEGLVLTCDPDAGLSIRIPPPGMARSTVVAA